MFLPGVHIPAWVGVSAVSVATLFASNYAILVADATVPPKTDWVDIAERLGILAAVVLFSVFTGAAILKQMVTRQAKREDLAILTDSDREKRMSVRIDSLEVKLVSLAESNGAIAQRSIVALESVGKSIEATVAISQSMQRTVDEFVSVRKMSACYAMNPEVLLMALKIRQLEAKQEPVDQSRQFG